MYLYEIDGSEESNGAMQALCVTNCFDAFKASHDRIPRRKHRQPLPIVLRIVSRQAILPLVENDLELVRPLIPRG